MEAAVRIGEEPVFEGEKNKFDLIDLARVYGVKAALSRVMDVPRNEATTRPKTVPMSAASRRYCRSGHWQMLEED